MITVDKQDAITLKINHAMAKTKKLDMDVYLFIPGELGLTPEVLSESAFFYSSITQKRAYYSDKTLLPLVHSRLAKRGRLSITQYRVSLSLFAYQYVIALDKAVNSLNKTDSDDVTADEVDEVIELALDILKKLRRSIPYEENLKRYYANIDNYLSWYTEQKFLSLVSHMPRGSEYSTIKERLLTLCEKETAHRKLNRYNSAKVREDVTRLSNKMRLLRRLIEHPIVLKEKTTSMGKNVKRAVKGIATGLVMVVVTTTVILARDFLGEITASFIVAMSFIYALREIFKDDLRDILWRWLRKGKPKWKRRYYDPTTNKSVGHKLEWLDYANFSKLADRIQSIRKKRVVQREEQILHYRSHTEMSTSTFMSGYEETRETLSISLRALTRLMDKGSNKVYRLNEGQVSRESVEKRHLLNLIIKENNHDNEPTYYRWKIVMNRSKIVDIEQITQES
ncbi:hypothetical protein VCRA2123O444_10451 [Vibrio crassostreae]|uniref:hypothetical protein n=1 Tax=Vibrio crassostreae TaxID=246167 RepID=UPI001B30987C|nr:hypothetical protein [Vibrio crassostreae]CAK1816990.1 hypothetical protein VCRA2119O431_10016 [Vibrio crassostreae]CAK1819245.1 hypothetical protein VCRA2114O422_10016 [Vibrio crassostreae]CAK1821601.1 hypothetical protein VCRA2113O409_10016 [Vibrio crassostreae]CAK1826183.1 hypothetical protein VCRA2119O430_10016 [Vibrio crassostreae]CAK1830690.1 hypothetical protein VCRA2113O412_10016 [Vibrio crassostreae]